MVEILFIYLSIVCGGGFCCAGGVLVFYAGRKGGFAGILLFFRPTCDWIPNLFHRSFCQRHIGLNYGPSAQRMPKLVPRGFQYVYGVFCLKRLGHFLNTSVRQMQSNHKRPTNAPIREPLASSGAMA
jgi:hypothetical protein